MIQGASVAQMWAGAVGGGGSLTPPDNPPTAGGLTFVAGTNRVSIAWTDPAGTFAHVQVGIYPDNTGASEVEPSYVAAVIGPGVESWDSGYAASVLNYLRDGTSLMDWWVRSENDGLVSAWVYVGNCKLA